MDVELFALTQYLRGTDGESLIEHAGRVCYVARAREIGFFHPSRIREGHESIIDPLCDIRVSGISRAAATTRTATAGELFAGIQRYVDCPPRNCHPAVKPRKSEAGLFGTADCTNDRSLQALREMGSARKMRVSAANAAATRIVVTMNFRELLISSASAFTRRTW